MSDKPNPGGRPRENGQIQEPPRCRRRDPETGELCNARQVWDGTRQSGRLRTLCDNGHKNTLRPDHDRIAREGGEYPVKRDFRPKRKWRNPD